MSRLPEPQDNAPRASDAERERAIAALTDHYVGGRLTYEELVERTESALVARTRPELDALIRDLPAMALPATATTPGRAARRLRRATRWTVSIMSGHTRRGRWHIDGSTVAVAFMGGVTLDLREALLEPPPGSDEVVITAFAFMGGIEILVPEGASVFVSGFSFMGGIDDRSRGGPAVPGVPSIHVRGFSMMGGVDVKTPKPKPPRDQQKAAPGTRPSIRADERAARRGLRRGQVPPGLERLIRRQLGPDGLDRILNERAAQRLRQRGIDPEALRNSIDAIVSWSFGERADLGAHTAPDGTVTILFTDIEGSATINERLGDHAWVEVLQEHNAIVRDQVAAFGGAVVRALGDGFMIVFPSARRAVQCAVGIQQAFDRYSEVHPDEPIRVRIGCHTGEAIRNEDDFFGQNVVMAARIADQATGGQIVVSSVTKELIESGGDVQFASPREVTLDGLSGTRTLYEVKWS